MTTAMMNEGHKFRKRPVEVEAFQMTEERWANREESEGWPSWLVEAIWNGPKGLSQGVWVPEVPEDTEPWCFLVSTLEGVMVGKWGDWIIQGVNGELYPCKPDVFEQTYERAR